MNKNSTIKMICKQNVIVLLMLLAAQQLLAQDSMRLKLNNAIELSLTNSRQLKISQARIDQASAILKQAHEARLPDVKVSGSYLQLNHPDISLKSKPSNGTNDGQIAKPSTAVYGMANITLPIYAGSRIKYGIDAAHFLEEALKFDAAFDKEKIVLNTIQAYTNLYKSLTQVRLVRDNLRQSQQRDKDLSNMEKNGLLARNDLLKAQLQTSNIELALVNAENDLHLSMVSLNLILGLPERTVLSIDSTDIPDSRPDVKSIETYEQLALSNRMDIKASSMRHNAAEAKVKQVRSEYFPSIGLTGGYIAADIPKVLTVTNALNAGIGIQYNLGSLWKTKSRIQQARAEEMEIRLSQEQMNDNIRMDVNSAYEHYYSSTKRNEVQMQALENAGENYRITKNKYENNLVTTTELLDASTALLEAQINLENSKADIFSAYNILLQRSGLLVDNNKK
jgi:outer membrane protein